MKIIYNTYNNYIKNKINNYIMYSLKHYKSNSIFKTISKNTTQLILPTTLQPKETTLADIWIRVLASGVSNLTVESQHNFIKKIKNKINFEYDFPLDDFIELANINSYETYKYENICKFTKKITPDKKIYFIGNFRELYYFFPKMEKIELPNKNIALKSRINFINNDVIIKIINSELKSHLEKMYIDNIKNINYAVINRKVAKNVILALNIRNELVESYNDEIIVNGNIIIDTGKDGYLSINEKTKKNFSEHNEIKNILDCFIGELPDKEKFTEEEGKKYLHGDKRDIITNAQLLQMTKANLNEREIGADVEVEISMVSGCCPPDQELRPKQKYIHTFIDATLKFMDNYALVAHFPNIGMFCNFGQEVAVKNDTQIEFTINDSPVILSTSM
jgi:hypothetical protein